MPSHWTYSDFSESSDLEQGDIISATPALIQIMSKYHSYFANDKYTGFIVATQSCDLVRRKGDSPKAPYINLAAIRPLNSISHQLIKQSIPSISEDALIFRRKDRAKAKELFERIFNQNEQALGLFFLHEDSDSGIYEASIAMLRISVALKNEHYHTLMNSRKGRLNEEFRAKLGWLIGNLYARPATRDWRDAESEGSSKLDSLVNLQLGQTTNAHKIFWATENTIKHAEKNSIQINTANLSELENIQTPSYSEMFSEIAVEVLSNLLNPNPKAQNIDPEIKNLSEKTKEELVRRLKSRLQNDRKVNLLIKSISDHGDA